ncbi:MAG: hypothetical protein HY744_20060 [Deltaproteobacteria bacterium]|nr:hypothetical protein [Deltaproteobacteria bacterium]
MAVVVAFALRGVACRSLPAPVDKDAVIGPDQKAVALSDPALQRVIGNCIDRLNYLRDEASALVHYPDYAAATGLGVSGVGVIVTTFNEMKDDPTTLARVAGVVTATVGSVIAGVAQLADPPTETLLRHERARANYNAGMAAIARASTARQGGVVTASATPLYYKRAMDYMEACASSDLPAAVPNDNVEMFQLQELRKNEEAAARQILPPHNTPAVAPPQSPSPPPAEPVD